jgi:hypothetical protein
VTSMQSARNPKLKQLEMSSQDILALALSVSRRDFLETMRDVLKPLIENPAQEERGTLTMFESMITSELKRRSDNQKKRVEFGFKDDPDKDE